jgi:hypothetical protein
MNESDDDLLQTIALKSNPEQRELFIRQHATEPSPFITALMRVSAPTGIEDQQKTLVLQRDSAGVDITQSSAISRILTMNNIPVIEDDVNMAALDVTPHIIIKRIVGSPISYNIRPLIDTKYAQDNMMLINPRAGLSLGVIAKYRTIINIGASSSDDHLSVFAHTTTPLDNTKIRIFDTLNGTKYRELAYDAGVVQSITTDSSPRPDLYNDICTNIILARAKNPQQRNNINNYAKSSIILSNEPLRRAITTAVLATALAKLSPPTLEKYLSLGITSNTVSTGTHGTSTVSKNTVSTGTHGKNTVSMGTTTNNVSKNTLNLDYVILDILVSHSPIVTKNPEVLALRLIKYNFIKDKFMIKFSQYLRALPPPARVFKEKSAEDLMNYLSGSINTAIEKTIRDLDKNKLWDLEETTLSEYIMIRS